jgi:uncharacterized protein YbcI
LASQTRPFPIRQTSAFNGRRGHGLPLGSAPLPPGTAAEKQAAGEISTRLVGLLRRHTGRGPTKARTVIASDLVLVALSDCLTIAENRVVEAGQGELVARMRGVLYDGIRTEATAIVEELNDARVSAYLAVQHDDPDLAILVFYLSAAPLRLA